MGKVTRREPRPGETIFGGKGILVPYRPRYDGGSRIPERANANEPTNNKEQVDGVDHKPGESTRPGDQQL